MINALLASKLSRKVETHVKFLDGESVRLPRPIHLLPQLRHSFLQAAHLPLPILQLPAGRAVTVPHHL